MLVRSSKLKQRVQPVAQWAVEQYARELLTVDEMVSLLMDEWKQYELDEEALSPKLLRRLAQRICSRVLHEACYSSDSIRRNAAFANLTRYLEASLRHSPYAQFLTRQADACCDVLQQTLEDLDQTLLQKVGPSDPAAFLKWTLTILLRHAYVFVQKVQREKTLAAVSIDEQPEVMKEYLEDNGEHDPVSHVLSRELQQTLKNAILSLRNPRYQMVLLGIYLAGMDEREIAESMGVQVQDVYLWRHRAIKALHSNRELIETLQSWLRR
ncbi:MAG TPA: sigma-70 family RNA polymerase sigma factor [Ktedonobacteraceae bacterium]|jgi:RNA polymerase sigma factor (sigma-70 family)|nr:sigma-70 family RNA polymerase sigma factor [Ktedonobacteraceae bacterium]